MTLSRRAQAISPSPTLALTAKARAMRAEGIPIIGFGAGEPDFDTPEHIKEAAFAAIDEGFTKYTPTSGIPELKEAVCARLREDSGLEYEPSQVMVSCGAKHSIYNIVQVLCDEGDEVIIPAPYWVSYPEMVRVAGGTPVIVDATEKTGFKVSADVVARYVTDRTKLLILNSPSNPTGAVYSKDELEGLAQLAADRNLWIISDEIYDKLVHDGIRQVSIASLGPRAKERTLVVNGVSKAYAMTGWRIGYVAGDKAVIAAMSNLQDHSTSNPTSIAQRAALAALRGSQESVRGMAREFEQRRDYMVDRLNEIPGFSCLKPQGAFYAFCNVSGVLGKRFGSVEIDGSMGLTKLLLTEAQVAVLPGKPFGADPYLRFSYATSMDNIVKGLDRVADFAARLT